MPSLSPNDYQAGCQSGYCDVADCAACQAAEEAQDTADAAGEHLRAILADHKQHVDSPIGDADFDFYAGVELGEDGLSAEVSLTLEVSGCSSAAGMLEELQLLLVGLRESLKCEAKRAS